LDKIWTRCSVFNFYNRKLAARAAATRDLYWSTAEMFLSSDFHIAQLFKIPYKQLMEIVYALSKDVHISWSEFNEMPFFEILMIIDQHNEFVEKQNDESNSADTSGDMIAQQQAQMQNMYQQQQRSMPKFEPPQMPQMPNFNNI
jgi:hypothetical protein